MVFCIATFFFLILTNYQFVYLVKHHCGLRDDYIRTVQPHNQAHMKVK